MVRGERAGRERNGKNRKRCRKPGLKKLSAIYLLECASAQFPRDGTCRTGMNMLWKQQQQKSRSLVHLEGGRCTGIYIVYVKEKIGSEMFGISSSVSPQVDFQSSCRNLCILSIQNHMWVTWRNPWQSHFITPFLFLPAKKMSFIAAS